MKEYYSVTAISKDPISKKTHLFLYYTEKGPINDQILGNRVYGYELDENGSRLTGSKLLLNLPWEPGPGHNGGVSKVGPDNNLYITVGDMISSSDNQSQPYETLAQNFQAGKEVDGRAGILRITQNGQPVGNGLLGSNQPLDLYYSSYQNKKRPLGLILTQLQECFGIQRMVLILVTR